MSTITLDQARLYMRLDESQHLDDEQVQVMIDATEAFIAKQLGADMPDTFEPPLVAAGLLMIGDMYRFRELQSSQPVYQNKTFSRLLHVYRSMNVEVSQ